MGSLTPQLPQETIQNDTVFLLLVYFEFKKQQQKKSIIHVGSHCPITQAKNTSFGASPRNICFLQQSLKHRRQGRCKPGNSNNPALLRKCSWILSLHEVMCPEFLTGYHLSSNPKHSCHLVQKRIKSNLLKFHIQTIMLFSWHLVSACLMGTNNLSP